MSVSSETHTECSSGKRFHLTAESATTQMASLNARRLFQGDWQRTGRELQVYKCPHCPGYHVGNKR